MEDQDALSRSAYYTHMKRFIEVHRKNAKPIYAEILIGLERVERWEKNGLPAAECPTLEQIEARRPVKQTPLPHARSRDVLRGG